MQYGMYECIKNVKNLAITKLFHHKARLIRYPCFIRNGRYINFNHGFTCGYNCRLECIVDQENCGNISFGENVKIGDNVHIASAQCIEVGSNVLMASHIFITDLNHGKYSMKSCDVPESIPDKRKLDVANVKINDNVWIGENVTILKGVEVGYGAIIGANSLVLHNVPPLSIVAGSPAKIIKKYNDKSKCWEKYDE